MVTKKTFVIMMIVAIISISIITAYALPTIKDVIIKESNLRFKVTMEGQERSYPLDIITQTRYDEYGRIIGRDWDRLEEMILIDKGEISKEREEEVFKNEK